MPHDLTSALDDLRRVVGEVIAAARADHKTMLSNERGLDQDGAGLLTSVDPWTVFSGDINDFKYLNAKLGYDRADQILDAIGESLAHTCSSSGGRGYRRGGDEFVLLVPASAAALVIEHLTGTLNPLTVALDDSSERIEVRASFGYTTLDKDTSFQANLDRADDACKAAKWRHDGKPLEWTAELPTGLYQRLRCGDCRSQFSIAVPPERASDVPQLSCMICQAPLAEA